MFQHGACVNQAVCIYQHARKPLIYGMVDFMMSERCRLSRILCVALVFPTPGACRAGPVIMRSMSLFYLRDKASCGGNAFPMSLCVCPNQVHLTTMQQLPVYLDSHEAAPPCSVSSQSNDGNPAGIPALAAGIACIQV